MYSQMQEFRQLSSIPMLHSSSEKKEKILRKLLFHLLLKYILVLWSISLIFKPGLETDYYNI